GVRQAPTAFFARHDKRAGYSSSFHAQCHGATQPVQRAPEFQFLRRSAPAEWKCNATRSCRAMLPATRSTEAKANCLEVLPACSEMRSPPAAGDGPLRQ